MSSELDENDMQHMDERQQDIERYADSIYYSNRYSDDHFEFRHVTLPKQLAKYLPNPMRLMEEGEWRGLGVRQSPGWFHYLVHAPEPHILLFKRERDDVGNPQNGA